ncbi:calcium-binding protein [Pantanalinema rosaneae CENA516]|uniref:calcium-binding protein n=1 Tax=Pantanalinema rosaneae TaxID=1620701 RepID=UPI003D6FF35A
MYFKSQVSIHPYGFAPELTTETNHFRHANLFDDHCHNLGRSSSHRVIPNNRPIAGYSQADLGDLWWQYIETIPVNQHFAAFDDTTDLRGRRGSIEKALINQPLDSVLLIGGAFGDLPQGVDGTYTIHRTIVLPPGTTTLFFPILNANASNLTTTPDDIDVNDPFVNGGRNYAQLRAAAAYWSNRPSENMNQPYEPYRGTGTSALFASIDGKTVQDPYNYRQRTQNPNGYISYPVAGGITEMILLYPPDTSYLANPQGQGKVATQNSHRYKSVTELGGYGQFEFGPLFADGYWLGVELRPGEHTLNFGGTFSLKDAEGALTPAFDLNITYNILNPIEGNRCDNNLYGTTQNDYLNGKGGHDRLFGMAGDDLVVGGNGADYLDGGIGNDELWGDQGADTFVFKQGYGQDMIYDFEVGDNVQLDMRRGYSITPVDVELSNQQSGAKLDFGGGDTLTFVGIRAEQLKIENGSIRLIPAC